jgi:hypothetical protein
MSNEGAPKDVSAMPRDKEPPAKDATSSLARKDSASETESERSVEVVEAKQSVEKNTAENGNLASEQKGQAKSAPPSGPVSAAIKASVGGPKDVEESNKVAENKVEDTPVMKALVVAPKDGEKSNKVAENKVKDTPVMKASVVAPKDVEKSNKVAENKPKDTPVMKASVDAPKDVQNKNNNNNKVAKSSTKPVTDSKPNVTSADKTTDAKDKPSKEAALAKAPKNVEKSEKVETSSTELFPDAKPDIASVDNITDAKNVPSQKATSAPKKFVSIQKGGDAAAGTPKAGDTKAVLPTEEKTTSEEQKGGPSPDKATKPDQKPPAMGDTKNAVRMEASSKDQKMKDSDKEESSRTKRSAAKSVDSVARKRKKGKFVSFVDHMVATFLTSML